MLKLFSVNLCTSNLSQPLYQQPQSTFVPATSVNLCTSNRSRYYTTAGLLFEIENPENCEQSRVELEFQFHTRLFKKNRFHGSPAENCRYLMVRPLDTARFRQGTREIDSFRTISCEIGILIPHETKRVGMQIFVRFTWLTENNFNIQHSTFDSENSSAMSAGTSCKCIYIYYMNMISTHTYTYKQKTLCRNVYTYKYYLSEHTHIHTHTSTYVHAHAHAHAHIHTHTHTHTIYSRKSGVNMRAHTYTYTYIYARTHARTHTHTQTHTHTHTPSARGSRWSQYRTIDT